MILLFILIPSFQISVILLSCALVLLCYSHSSCSINTFVLLSQLHNIDHTVRLWLRVSSAPTDTNPALLGHQISKSGLNQNCFHYTCTHNLTRYAEVALNGSLTCDSRTKRHTVHFKVPAASPLGTDSPGLNLKIHTAVLDLQNKIS